MRSLTLLLVAAVLAGLAGGGVVVHRLGAAGPAQAAASEATPADVSLAGGEVDDDPGPAAARLTAARMEAVVALTNAPATAEATLGSTTGEEKPDGWAEVLVPGSPAHVQAAELVSRLRAEGARISGLTVETKDVVVLTQVAASESAPGTAQVQVTFSVSAYTVESPAGSQTIPAGAPRTVVLELVATDSRWLVATVREPAPPP